MMIQRAGIRRRDVDEDEHRLNEVFLEQGLNTYDTV
jgi:hypothetical protein